MLSFTCYTVFSILLSFSSLIVASVYSFCTSLPNDIDILLLYSEYSEKINLDSAILSSILENKFGLPIDLTILSINEEKETMFLSRLNSLYLKLK